jgi:hypothetical protein
MSTARRSPGRGRDHTAPAGLATAPAGLATAPAGLATVLAGRAR